jgi:HK97 family phage prohead protease
VAEESMLVSGRTAPATAPERREAVASFGDQEALVYQALIAWLGDDAADDDGYVDIWIRDLATDWVVWNSWVTAGPGPGLWKLAYTLGDDGAVTFSGDPEAVVAQTTYVPVEAKSRARHRAVSSEIVRTAREDMRNVRETRGVPISGFELREVPNGSGGTNLQFEGYASVTCTDQDDDSHAYEMEDWIGPWTESIVRGAFSKTLEQNADVTFLVNHEGVSMSRTKAGSLRLSEDLTGLHVDATLNPSRPDVQVLRAAVQDGAVDEMSFAFRVVRQRWSYAEENGVEDRRWLTELNLDKGDVSPVNYGANPHTGGLVSMRSAMTILNARGITWRAFAGALKDIRAGATLSQPTLDVLQPILDDLAAIDKLADSDQPKLAALLGASPPEEPAPDAEALAAAAIYLIPDHTMRARAELAAMTRR